MTRLNFKNLTNDDKLCLFERWQETMDYYSCRLSCEEEGMEWDKEQQQSDFEEWCLTFV